MTPELRKGIKKRREAGRKCESRRIWEWEREREELRTWCVQVLLISPPETLWQTWVMSIRKLLNYILLLPTGLWWLAGLFGQSTSCSDEHCYEKGFFFVVVVLFLTHSACMDPWKPQCCRFSCSLPQMYACLWPHALFSALPHQLRDLVNRRMLTQIMSKESNSPQADSKTDRFGWS